MKHEYRHAGALAAHREPRLHLLPLIPVCHGFLALATFCLATVTAASGAG